MKKIILDDTNKSLEVLLDVTPVLPFQFTASWADATDTTLVESSSHGTISTAATTTIVAAPAASARRGIVDYSVYNPNATAVSGSLIYKESTNSRIIRRFKLSPNETLTTEGVFTASGRQRIDSGGGDREVLTANRTYFVRTDGNDSNTGFANTSGGAFLTIQKAIDTAAGLDFSIFDVTIQLGNGTFTGSVVLKSFFGSGSLILQGNNSSPSSVVITSSVAGTGITATLFGTGVVGKYIFRDFRVAASGASLNAISVGNNTSIEYQNLDFGVANGVHLLSFDAGLITCTGNYSISGGAAAHYWSNSTGIIRCAGRTINLLNNISVSRAFALSDYTGILTANGNTYALGGFTVTGKRYQSDYGALIITAGGGANYFPGTIAGTPVPGATEAQIHSAFYGQYT